MKERKPDHKLTEEERREVVKEYRGGLSTYKLAEKFIVDASSIYLILKKRGVVLRTRAEAHKHVLTESQEKKVVEKYQNMMNGTQLAKEFGVNSELIISILRRWGISRRSMDLAARKYKVFDGAFVSLLGEDSQYWAGFLDADGCIQESGNSYRITVGLQKGDREHLVKLRQFLKTDAPIHQSENSYVIGVSSKQMGKRLISLGITPRKSYKDNKIDEKLAYSKHFWRGMIDGDGYVSISKKGLNRCGLCGSHNLMVQFSDYVESISGFRNNVRKNRNIYAIAFVGKKAKFLAKHFYENATIYLDRKKETADKIIQKP